MSEKVLKTMIRTQPETQTGAVGEAFKAALERAETVTGRPNHG